MNYEEQIKQILEESKVDIQSAIKENMQQKIISSIDWNLSSNLSDIVKQWISDNLKDEIYEMLNGSKQAILDEIRPAIATSGVLVAKNLQETIEKTMADSYRSNEIIKKMLGAY